MILDVTMKDRRFFVTIHKNILDDDLITGRQGASYLSDFIQPGDRFGYGGTLKKEKKKEHQDYLFYIFDFPKQTKGRKEGIEGDAFSVEGDDWIWFLAFIETIHHLCWYQLETLFHEKFRFGTTIWEDQSFSYRLPGNYGVGGFMFPWVKRQFASLQEKEVKNLCAYVDAEIQRFGLYLTGREYRYTQVSMTSSTWFIQVTAGGRHGSASWPRDFQMDRNFEFSSDNMDNQTDQAVLFVGIVAMNTWLRNRSIVLKEREEKQNKTGQFSLF